MSSQTQVWTEGDLHAYVTTGAQESLTLEFKSSDALALSDSKKNEISKDVAAFANSAGGTIIYGIREVGHIATEIDSGSDPTVVTKEWLEQVINSRIQRRIDGVKISQVQLLTAALGRVAYVVEIPQSGRAPHQSWDKRFYRRFNFESVPMEEYEIRDVANRTATPDLEISFSPTTVPLPIGSEEPVGAWSRFDLRPTIENASSTPAEYASIFLFIDSRLKLPSGHDGMRRATSVLAQTSGTNYPCEQLHLNWAVPGKMPIFDGIRMLVLDPGPLHVEPPYPGSYFIGWKVLSPRMQPRTQMLVVHVTASSCVLQPSDA